MNDQKEQPLTVSELTDLIKSALNVNLPGPIILKGEVSNFKLSKTNVFFTLKDENSSINGVIWNYTSKSKSNSIKDGDTLELVGNLTIFQKADFNN